MQRWHTEDTYERFTHQARRVVVLAQQEAREQQHFLIGTEHILLGLIREESGVAAQVLGEMGVTLETVRERVKQQVRPLPATTPMRTLPFTQRVQKVLELALREAFELHSDYVDTEHLLLGLLRDGDGAVQVLSNLGADPSVIRQRILEVVARSPSVAEEGAPTIPISDKDPGSLDRSVMLPARRRVGEVLKALVGRNRDAGMR